MAPKRERLDKITVLNYNDWVIVPLIVSRLSYWSRHICTWRVITNLVERPIKCTGRWTCPTSVIHLMGYSDKWQFVSKTCANKIHEDRGLVRHLDSHVPYRTINVPATPLTPYIGYHSTKLDLRQLHSNVRCSSSGIFRQLANRFTNMVHVDRGLVCQLDIHVPCVSKPSFIQIRFTMNVVIRRCP